MTMTDSCPRCVAEYLIEAAYCSKCGAGSTQTVRARLVFLDLGYTCS